MQEKKEAKNRAQAPGTNPSKEQNWIFELQASDH
jgi:hypothetical protein